MYFVYVCAGTTASLIKQLGGEEKQGEVEEEGISLTTQDRTQSSRGRKMLIEEISTEKKKPKNKSDDLFGKNLQKAFSDKNGEKRGEKDDNDEAIKIRQQETFLKEVNTRRFNKGG